MNRLPIMNRHCRLDCCAPAVKMVAAAIAKAAKSTRFILSPTTSPRRARVSRGTPKVMRLSWSFNVERRLNRPQRFQNLALGLEHHVQRIVLLHLQQVERGADAVR